MAISYIPETFEPHIGSIFTARIADVTNSLELIEVQRGAATANMFQFSLFFKGPAESLLQQQTLHLSHQELGELDMFIVPVAKEGSCVVYQVAFTQMMETPARGT